MVISNIARREIAQKFYMEAQAWRYTLPDDVCDLGDASAVMQDMCYFVGLQGNVLYCDIFQRFAELIDPTVCEDSGDEERAAKCGKHSDGIDVSKCVIRLIDPPTCHNLATKPADEFLCSKCGEHVDIVYMETTDDYHAQFCPKCGSEVLG